MKEGNIDRQETKDEIVYKKVIAQVGLKYASSKRHWQLINVWNSCCLTKVHLIFFLSMVKCMFRDGLVNISSADALNLLSYTEDELTRSVAVRVVHVWAN